MTQRDISYDSSAYDLDLSHNLFNEIRDTYLNIMKNVDYTYTDNINLSGEKLKVILPEAK